MAGPFIHLDVPMQIEGQSWKHLRYGGYPALGRIVHRRKAVAKLATLERSAQAHGPRVCHGAPVFLPPTTVDPPIGELDRRWHNALKVQNGPLPIPDRGGIGEGPASFARNRLRVGERWRAYHGVLVWTVASDGGLEDTQVLGSSANDQKVSRPESQSFVKFR